MSVIKISKNDNLEIFFQDTVKSGLINYQDTGYERWHWQYTQNPFCLEWYPTVWIYSVNNKAIAHVGAIPAELQVGPKKILIGWCVDLKALSEYKTKSLVFPGKALVREANKHFDVYMTTGQTDMAYRLLVSMRWKVLGNIPYYVKIWDSRIFVSKKFKNVIIAKIVSLLVNLLLRFFNYAKRPGRCKTIEVLKIENFNEDADALWKEIAEYFKVVVPRNKAYLSWRYDKQPAGNYAKFRAMSANKLRGYIIARAIKTKARGMEGLITDIVARPDDKETVNELIFTALKYLNALTCSTVRCLMNNKAMEKCLRNQGFIKRESSVRFLLNKNIEGLEEMYQLGNWHIMAGDCDLDR